MDSLAESAALVSLLRTGKRPARCYAELVEEAGSALAVLDAEGSPQGRLFAAGDLAETAAEIERWRSDGIELLTVLDPRYPSNLRRVHDRPPLIFVSGRLVASDARSAAVVGARAASDGGVKTARQIAHALVDADYVVFSGLAAGVDAAAHGATLDRGARTVAVLGTGLRRVYPPEHVWLQRRIAAEGALVSQFWPDAPPSRHSFPMRNAVMSGMTLATVVVEAAFNSGARMQARLALEHGRPAILLRSLLEQEWAREFACRPGVHVASAPEEVVEILDRLTALGPLAR